MEFENIHKLINLNCLYFFLILNILITLLLFHTLNINIISIKENLNLVVFQQVLRIVRQKLIEIVKNLLSNIKTG